jgi:hypothetical protein
MTDDRHRSDVVQTATGFLHVSEVDEERVSANPVVHHMSVYKTRARMMDESRVEQKARQLQAASSYADWSGLSDDDKELWRHMARLELL